MFTVLLVEDAQDVRDVLAELLELHGMRVVAAGSVAEALAVAREAGTVDLLLTDLNLPDGSGGQVAERLMPGHPHMRSLFLSGDRPPPLAPGQAFIQKPASLHTILGQIRSLLPQSA